MINIASSKHIDSYLSALVLVPCAIYAAYVTWPTATMIASAVVVAIGIALVAYANVSSRSGIPAIPVVSAKSKRGKVKDIQ